MIDKHLDLIVTFWAFISRVSTSILNASQALILIKSNNWYVFFYQSLTISRCICPTGWQPDPSPLRCCPILLIGQKRAQKWPERFAGTSLYARPWWPVKFGWNEIGEQKTAAALVDAHLSCANGEVDNWSDQKWPFIEVYELIECNLLDCCRKPLHSSISFSWDRCHTLLSW
jgi:hypothetical protein